MVIELRPQSFASTVAHECVATLRNRMRACDLVGMLSETDIGLLLHNTSEQDAPVVEARVRQIVQDVDALLGAEGIAIGVATRMPGDTVTQPILAEARARVPRSLARGATP
jgi:PleD family two-component response regulator